MSTQVVVSPAGQVTRAGLKNLPAVIADAGESVSRRFVEFFTANIRDRTRAWPTCPAHPNAESYLDSYLKDCYLTSF